MCIRYNVCVDEDFSERDVRDGIHAAKDEVAPRRK